MMSNEACVTDLWQKRRSKGMEEEEPAEGGSKKLIFEKKPVQERSSTHSERSSAEDSSRAVSKRPSTPCKRPNDLNFMREADSVREERLSAHMQRLSALFAKKSFKLFLFSFSRIYLVFWKPNFWRLDWRAFLSFQTPFFQV